MFAKLNKNYKSEEYAYKKSAGNYWIITIKEWNETAECWINQDEYGIAYHVIGIIKNDYGSNWKDILLEEAKNVIESREEEE